MNSRGTPSQDSSRKSPDKRARPSSSNAAKSCRDNRVCKSVALRVFSRHDWLFLPQRELQYGSFGPESSSLPHGHRPARRRVLCGGMSLACRQPFQANCLESGVRTDPILLRSCEAELGNFSARCSWRTTLRNESDWLVASHIRLPLRLRPHRSLGRALRRTPV